MCIRDRSDGLWSGRAWRGMVWWFMVWKGVARHGLMGYGLEGHGAAWSDGLWSGRAWRGMVWWFLIWKGMAWHGLIVYGLEGHCRHAMWHQTSRLGHFSLFSVSLVIMTLTNVLSPNSAGREKWSLNVKGSGSCKTLLPPCDWQMRSADQHLLGPAVCCPSTTAVGAKHLAMLLWKSMVECFGAVQMEPLSSMHIMFTTLV